MCHNARERDNNDDYTLIIAPYENQQEFWALKWVFLQERVRNF